MTLDKIKKRIESLLSSEKRWPVIVDFSNKNDLKDFLYHFDVGNNTFFSAGELCGEYGSVKLEELSNLVENNEGNFFLVHLSAYLKLYGENELKNTLKSLISKSINGHVIIVTYQCRKYLEFSDSRFYERGQILIAEDEFDENPDICMVSPDLKDAFEKVYDGFNKIGYAYETSTEKILYVATGVDKSLFELSLIHVDKLNNGYDILCSKDSRIKNVPESFGEPSRWNGLLKDMGSADLSQVVAYSIFSVLVS